MLWSAIRGLWLALVLMMVLVLVVLVPTSYFRVLHG